MARNWKFDKSKISNFDIGEDLYQRLRKESFDQQRPQAGIVRQALMEHFDRQDEERKAARKAEREARKNRPMQLVQIAS